MKNIWLYLTLLVLMFTNTAYSQAIGQPVRDRLQDAASVGNGNAANTLGYTLIGVQIIATGDRVVNFEGTVDGTTWSTVTCRDLSSATNVTTTVTSGMFSCGVGGLSRFRARVSGGTNGVITVEALVLSNAAANQQGSISGTGIIVYVEASRPETCTANTTIIVVPDSGSCKIQVCNSTGDGWSCSGGIGYTAENIVNKTADTALGNSDMLYPTQKAVSDFVLSTAKTITNTRLTPRVFAQSDTTPITIDSNLYDFISISELSQATTFNAPSGTPTNGQFLSILVFTTTQRTLSFSTAANGFSAANGLALPTLTETGAYVQYGFRWSSVAAKWMFIASTQTTTRGAVTQVLTSNGATSEPSWQDAAGVGATVVKTDQTNTWTTGAQDMGAATSFIVPKAAGAAPTADGDIRYDTTREDWKVGGNGITGRFRRTLSCTRPNQTLTNSVTTDQDFTAIYTIPANFLTTGRVLQVSYLVQHVADGAPSVVTPFLKLGTTKVLTAGTATPTSNITRSQVWSFLIFGTAAPGAAVSVDTSIINFRHEMASSESNTTAQPVSLATNGTLAVVPGINFSTDTGGESQTILSACVEEVN